MKTEQEKKEERYLISETAKLVGVESHVLRYWEEELKLPIRRNELGHRYYTEEDVKQFREIKKLKEQGLQLKAIRTVLTAEGSMQILMPVPNLTAEEEKTSDREEKAESKMKKVPKEAGKARDITEGVPDIREKAPAEQVSDAGEKAMRLQMLLHGLISQAVRENNEELARQLRDTVTKEMDYQFRVQEEESRKREQIRVQREEEHFRKLDETLRQYAGRRGRILNKNSRMEARKLKQEAAKAQKEEARAQKEAARAQKAEAKAQKEAARMQKAEAKAQKEAARMQKAEERAQREAARRKAQ